MQKTPNPDILKIYAFPRHILPGLDHGCSDTAVAMEQIRRAVRAEVHCILATSHFYPHAESVDSFLRRRRLAWVQLQKELAREEEIRAAGIQIVQGAEVLICKGLERMEGLEQLCIDGTKVLLLEMPFTEIWVLWDAVLIYSVIAFLDKCGLQVVLAHVERYRMSQIMPLLEAGCLAQVNIGSLVGRWNRQRFRAQQYLSHDRISALGSDIHGVGDQYTDFTHIIKKHNKAVGMIMERTRELLGERTDTHPKIP